MKRTKSSTHVSGELNLFQKILIAIGCIVLFIIVKKIAGNIAERTLNDLIVSYPFTFENESDSPLYVTGNFNVQYVFKKGDKSYKVKWTSSDTNAVNILYDGSVAVVRPEDESQTVVLTAIYKNFLGKATRDFNIKLIPNNSISISDISIVSVESIKDASYDKEMDVYCYDDGSISEMYGDFGDTYIYSEADAKIVADAYKEQFGLDDTFELILSGLSHSDALSRYDFDLVLNGYPVLDEAVTLNTNSSDELISVKSTGINKNIIIDFTENEELDFGSILSNEVQDSYEIEDEFYAVYDRRFAKVFDVSCDDSAYEIIFDAQTGDIIDEINLLAEKRLENQTASITGKDENGNDRQFEDAIVLSENPEKYWLSSDSRKMYFVTDNPFPKKFNFLKAKIETVEDSENKEIIIEGRKYDSYKVETEVFDNAINVYDFYFKVLGRAGYSGDNKNYYFIVTDSKGDGATTFSGYAGLGMLSEFGFKKDYMTSLGASQDIVGHEFTHAVFATENIDSLGGKKYLEVDSINEAYCDVMGILSALYTDKKLKKDDPDNWIIGRMELDADAINERYMGSDELNIIQNVLTDNGKIKKRTIVGKRDLCNVNFDNQYIGDILGQNEGKKEGLFNKQYSYEKKTGEIYKYPENYIEKNGESYNGRDSYWNSENEHINSVMLSHIAYRMCSSSEVDFSVEQVAKIWYESLLLKYSNKSQFTDFATNLYEASDTLMKEGKINSAQFRFVEMCLADAGIRSMPKYSTVNKSNFEGYKQSSDVESLDENGSENENRFGHEFITVYSVFSGKVTIYEEGKSLSDDKQKEVDEYKRIK